MATVWQRLAGLSGTAYEAGLRRLAPLDIEYEEDKKALSAATANKLPEDDNKIAEKCRANYARDVGLAAQYYQQLAALGQKDMAAHLRGATERTRDENLGKEDQRRYEKEVFDTRRNLDQQAFDRAKSLGAVSERACRKGGAGVH